MSGGHCSVTTPPPASRKTAVISVRHHGSFNARAKLGSCIASVVHPSESPPSSDSDIWCTFPNLQLDTEEKNAELLRSDLTLTPLIHISHSHLSIICTSLFLLFIILIIFHSAIHGTYTYTYTSGGQR